jgi:signal transduction histidine kinase
LFLNDVRVATNVRGARHERAIGTRVSEPVRQRVLVEGKTWQARAWVVDEWYFSAYEPLRDPQGRILGMLYVGLLEAPYSDLRWTLIGRLLWVLGLVAVLAVPIAVLLVTRVTSPLNALVAAARGMARGEREVPVGVPKGYREVTELTVAFREMQTAIAERDRSLQRQNVELTETNQHLERANRNYMTTLGFVTHELKAPLAAMQMMIDAALPVYKAQVPEQVAAFMGRIKRSLEELQDMVKNYLDLSRAERGELEAHPCEIDLKSDVIDPCLLQVGALFSSRNISLKVDAPAQLSLFADPELLRIALVNYLSNAAKYGREGGAARLSVETDGAKATLSVWNEGAGFKPAEREKLFQKFSRLKNSNTRGKRGSGLGLFLVRHIAMLHGGSAWGESEPDQWAQFFLSIPLQTVATSAPSPERNSNPPVAG